MIAEVCWEECSSCRALAIGEELEHLICGHLAEIVDDPICTVASQGPALLAINAKDHGEAAMASGHYPGDCILNDAGSERIRGGYQLGKALQKDIRFRFAAKMEAVAHDAVDDLVKELADSGLLHNRHRIPAG